MCIAAAFLKKKEECVAEFIDVLLEAASEEAHRSSKVAKRN
jgi:hypothetical protein